MCSECVCGGACNLSSVLLTHKNLIRGKKSEKKISVRKPNYSKTLDVNPIPIEVNGEILSL